MSELGHTSGWGSRKVDGGSAGPCREETGGQGEGDRKTGRDRETGRQGDRETGSYTS